LFKHSSPTRMMYNVICYSIKYFKKGQECRILHIICLYLVFQSCTNCIWNWLNCICTIFSSTRFECKYNFFCLWFHKSARYVLCRYIKFADNVIILLLYFGTKMATCFILIFLIDRSFLIFRRKYSSKDATFCSQRSRWKTFYFYLSLSNK